MPAVLVGRFDGALPISGFGYGGASRTGARGREAPDFCSPVGRFPFPGSVRKTPFSTRFIARNRTMVSRKRASKCAMRVRYTSCRAPASNERIGVMKERRRDSYIRASVRAPGGVVSSAAPRDNPNHILGVIAL